MEQKPADARTGMNTSGSAETLINKWITGNSYEKMPGLIVSESAKYAAELLCKFLKHIIRAKANDVSR